ncbi:DUF3944 domain-containing protein [Salmonella enterica subsp. enterica]|nr:DUF3944 domain-containing protein [Salmonella enterica subsp. enterica serovar Litchfield]EDV1958900.1 DUF3944 domain-containing protein [Salmonella enterica subsp. enterica serovar Litchfield]EDX0663398.1 DUF3944 domain-containing protein [Salmonella enterica]EFR1052003.1 DUF3944 domain-containing protein [Salmonella enterica]EGH5257750.1 DUF3944 domain-containing protein [Salmonella enterica]
MNVTYLHDEDLDFLQHCSEEQLADFARLLTHNEKGKARLSSVLSHNELFKAMSGSAYRVTIPAVLQIACLRRMMAAVQA